MKEPFRYERVKRVREIEEELAREDFLARERIARQAEEMAAAMQAELEKAQRELSETRLYRRVPPEELLTAQTTLEALGQNVSEQARRARDLRTEAETQRATWEGARTGVKTLEQLGARHEAAARETERQREARELDEATDRARSADAPVRWPVRTPETLR